MGSSSRSSGSAKKIQTKHSIQETPTSVISTDATPDDIAGSPAEIERRVMIAGFEKATTREEIRGVLEEVVKELGVSAEKIYAVRPTTSFGLIRFKEKAQLDRFKANWLNQSFEKLHKG